MTRALVCLALIAALGCGDDDDLFLDADTGTDATDASDAPDGDASDTDLADTEEPEPTCTVSLYDLDSEVLANWPERELLVEDDSTDTGVRVTYDAERFPILNGRPNGYVPVFTEDLPTLDGFGINAEAFFRFGRAFDVTQIPTGDVTRTADAGIGFVVLGEPGAAPRLEGALVTTTDEGSTLMLAPMAPLPEQSLVAAYVTRALTDAGRGCLEPSPRLVDRLTTPDALDQRAIDALIALDVIAGKDELVALTTFPTQTVTRDSLAIAADIAERSFTLVASTCETEALFIRCEASFVANDYRGEGGVIAPRSSAPVAQYTLPITAWLPKEGAPPYDTLVWGSGLGSGREQGRRLASFAAPAGIATVAIDPFSHGDHPAIPEGESRELLPTVLRFFTIGDLRERAVRPLVLRDNWRQAAYDKLQFTKLLMGGVDFTGDGMNDVRPETLSYLGVSLGGIMGVELLALSEDYGAAVLVVPGGRVSSIVSDSATIGALVELLRPRGTSEGDVARFFPVLQTLLEPGDAASYGPHVIGQRLRGDRAPHIMMGVVLDDDTVPNVANYTLGRALGLPIMPPVLRAEPGFPLSPMPPFSNNLLDGTVTGGMLQFDVVRKDGEVRDATHGNVGDSETGVYAWLSFLSSYFEGGDVVFEDPYAATMLDHE